jgi:branched-chain amino acid transport system substrate-binding protein
MPRATRRSLIASAAALAGTAALGGRAVARQAATPIPNPPPYLTGAAWRIGGSCALSGRFGAIGVYQWQGYDLWARDVNARGGLLDKPVALTIADDTSDPTVAAAHYAGMIARDAVDAFLPAYSSTVLSGVVPVLREANWPLVMAGGSVPSIVEGGIDGFCNIYVPERDFLKGIVLDHVVEAGLKTVVVVGQAGEFGDAARTGAVATLRAEGIEPVLDEGYPREVTAARDLADLAARIAALQPDAVLAATYVADGIALADALRSAGARPQVLALTIAPTSPTFVTALGQAAEGILGPTFWEPGIDTPGNAAFEAAYAAAWPADTVEYHVATGYAIGQVLEAAALRAGTLEPRALAAALSGLRVETVLPGAFVWGSDGYSTGAVALTIQIQGGKPVVVGPAAYAADAAAARPFAGW